MTATAVPTTATATATRPATSLRRTTVVSGLVAAAVTTASAAAVHAAGVSFEIENEMIPVVGFAQMTFVGAVIGGLLLAGLNRWSRSARTRFVQATVALTALSCVPSVAMPDDAGSVAALVALHVLAAVLIVPALARHARH
jgi:peptidoglycan/LPS O-acetylase OafA/YrhL